MEGIRSLLMFKFSVLMRGFFGGALLDAQTPPPSMKICCKNDNGSYKTFVEGARVKRLNERKRPCQRSPEPIAFVGSTTS